jgi:hypothetical protein
MREGLKSFPHSIFNRAVNKIRILCGPVGPGSSAAGLWGLAARQRACGAWQLGSGPVGPGSSAAGLWYGYAHKFATFAHEPIIAHKNTHNSNTKTIANYFTLNSTCKIIDNTHLICYNES